MVTALSWPPFFFTFLSLSLFVHLTVGSGAAASSFLQLNKQVINTQLITELFLVYKQILEFWITHGDGQKHRQKYLQQRYGHIIRTQR